MARSRQFAQQLGTGIPLRTGKSLAVSSNLFGSWLADNIGSETSAYMRVFQHDLTSDPTCTRNCCIPVLLYRQVNVCTVVLYSPTVVYSSTP